MEQIQIIESNGYLETEGWGKFLYMIYQRGEFATQTKGGFMFMEIQTWIFGRILI